MKLDYNFYETDESFDFGDFPGGTFISTEKHGFSIEHVSKTNKLDINSLKAYGDYEEMNNIKSLEELKEYILSHLDEVQDFDYESRYTNREIFEELIEIIDENLQGLAA
jgi:hypothetical protein